MNFTNNQTLMQLYMQNHGLVSSQALNSVFPYNHSRHMGGSCALGNIWPDCGGFLEITHH